MFDKTYRGTVLITRYLLCQLSMLCIKPFRKPSVEFGCGQCLSCRINRRRTWAGRILLESLACKESAFVTLTYAPEHLPQNGSLSKAHWREFTKGIGLRYFGCGEYGRQGNRPHYHLVLFGIDAAAAEALALKRWRYGFVCVRPFVREHAEYVAGYVVKKLTRPDDVRLPEGCIPEFALMSRRPGVGVSGVQSWIRWYSQDVGRQVLSTDLDVAPSIRAGRSVYPLGRTLRRHMRDALGVPHDLPARTMRREAQFRAVQANPVAKAARERQRVNSYHLARVRAGRPRGVL